MNKAQAALMRRTVAHRNDICEFCARTARPRPGFGKLRYAHKCQHGADCERGKRLNGSHANWPTCKECMPICRVLMMLAEYERRWRARRADDQNPLNVNPHQRVGRNEMADWCRERGLQVDPLLDDDLIRPYLAKLMRRLRREFPDEPWDRFT